LLALLAAWGAVLNPLRSTWAQVLAAAAVSLAALAVVLVTRGSSPASPPTPRTFLASMFQDDDHLLYSPDATVARTLDQLKALGVNQVRATVLWKAIAPNPASPTRPAGFNSLDPAAYPAGSWAPYDRLVRLAQARGITVDFDLTAPGPLWAMAPGAPAAAYADHWSPSAKGFQHFVAAVGKRYSGQYVPPGAGTPLPRVSFWSVWNEPNQQGWLAPQWQVVNGQHAMESAALYRSYVDAAFSALEQTGHDPSRDTILVGELAPEGSARPNYDYRNPIPPLPFLRALYCVDASFRPLSGAAAVAIGCPGSGGGAGFARAHPALFQASGFAHHPYSFFLAPSTSMPDPSFAPLADLGRLEQELDAVFRTYAVSRTLPIYLTEYGYETYPPNPWRGVSLRLQSLYLNEAQYMAWRDPRVRTMSQFLLYDARPDGRYPVGSQKYWSTFQTGLLFAQGHPKPSYASYRLPLFLPNPVLGTDGTVLMWGMIRPGLTGAPPQVRIQWRSQSGGAYRTLITAIADQADQVFAVRVHVPGPGVLRLAWTSPGGQVFYSRRAGVRARQTSGR
jgi:Cellulase (glycosyl hydrolase family 5)